MNVKTTDPTGMVFVFGSNLSGIHGAGAALYATKQRGAVLGVGEGMTGECYALPTKGIAIVFMSDDEIQTHVEKFLVFAYDHPELNFQVTQVGCGLAGGRPEIIAPMFMTCPTNCYFDTGWSIFLGPNHKFWGTF
ncbi:MAG: hypothetical protein JKX96_04420 [Acinetobacter sp.]|nr:hypothetical protein [Acinetobacter sp.]